MDDGFELLLADGRVAVLSGLAANGTPAGYADFAASLAGADIRLAPLDAKPDRWGRIVAAAFTADGRENFGERALAAGLARYRPDAPAKPCRGRLLRAENTARAGRLGIWASPGAILDASDARAILAAPKGLVIVEGRVLSIGEQRGRVYLNFGPRRTMDFTIVISKRNLALFEAAGLKPRDLTGRRVRVRGLVDRGFGPLMEIVTPDALESLDGVREAADKDR